VTLRDGPYDPEREDYASLADEMNDPGPDGKGMVWVEADWDATAVANAKKYAKKFGYPWPPSMGDFDRWYERQYGIR
jgi:hypothetical protein